VAIEGVEPVDLVIAGCVAVGPDGARLGKGGGFSDLEYAIARDAGLINSGTVLATTVHELQVVDAGAIPMTNHDFRLDLIVTPDRVIRCARPRAALPAHHSAILWDDLTEDKIAAIPLLQALRVKSR
jgi:5-formyltetrahydrofolate cyclo-ligase